MGDDAPNFEYVIEVPHPSAKRNGRFLFWVDLTTPFSEIKESALTEDNQILTIRYDIYDKIDKIQIKKSYNVVRLNVDHVMFEFRVNKQLSRSCIWNGIIGRDMLINNDTTIEFKALKMTIEGRVFQLKFGNPLSQHSTNDRLYKSESFQEMNKKYYENHAKYSTEEPYVENEIPEEKSEEHSSTPPKEVNMRGSDDDSTEEDEEDDEDSSDQYEEEINYVVRRENLKKGKENIDPINELD